MLDFNYLKKQSEQSPLWWFGIVQKPRAQKLQPDTGQLTPPFPFSSLPTLLFSHEWHSHLCCCHPQNNARMGHHCVFLWWQVWKVTMHEMQWEGIGEGTEEFFYLFLELIGLGMIFTLALPSSLPFPAKDTISWTHNMHQAANHPVRAPSQCPPLLLQFPPTETHMSKHTLIKNELQLQVNHIQIAVSEIRGKNEITYAKTQIVHNLRRHMRNTIFRWHSPGFIWRRYIHD